MGVGVGGGVLFLLLFWGEVRRVFCVFLLWLFVGCCCLFVWGGYTEGRPGMSDASPPPAPFPSLSLSGTSGLSFDSPFLSPLLLFFLVFLVFLSCHFSANDPFSCLFPENSQIFYVNS